MLPLPHISHLPRVRTEYGDRCRTFEIPRSVAHKVPLRIVYPRGSLSTEHLVLLEPQMVRVDYLGSSVLLPLHNLDVHCKPITSCIICFICRVAQPSLVHKDATAPQYLHYLGLISRQSLRVCLKSLPRTAIFHVSLRKIPGSLRSTALVLPWSLSPIFVKLTNLKTCSINQKASRLKCLKSSPVHNDHLLMPCPDVAITFPQLEPRTSS